MAKLTIMEKKKTNQWYGMSPKTASISMKYSELELYSAAFIQTPVGRKMSGLRHWRLRCQRGGQMKNPLPRHIPERIWDLLPAATLFAMATPPMTLWEIK